MTYAGGLALFMSFGHSFFGAVYFFRGVTHPPTMFGDEDVTWRFVHGGWHFLAVPLFMSALGLFALAFTDYVSALNPVGNPRPGHLTGTTGRRRHTV